MKRGIVYAVVFLIVSLNVTVNGDNSITSSSFAADISGTATSSGEWTLVFANDVHGKPTFGSLQALIMAVRDGAPVRFNVGPGDALMDGQTVEIQNNVVCAQNTSHVSISWIDDSMRVQDDPYYAFYTVCTSADVNVSRWLVGSHTPFGVTQTRNPIKWFVQGREIPNQDQLFGVLKEYYHAKIYIGDKDMYRVGDIYEILQNNGLRKLNFDSVIRLNARILRNEIYARHGKIFTTPELMHMFESAQWYKPRRDFKETELNVIEKRNISFIDEYEKSNGWK